MRFNEQRKLQIAQLNRRLRTVSAEFDNVLHAVLQGKDGKSLFSSQAEQRQYLDTLDNCRLRFEKGVEIADVGVKANLRSLGYYAGAEARVTEQDDLMTMMAILRNLPK